MRKLILIPVLALICTPLIAQRGFSGGRVGAHFGGRFSSQRYSRNWAGYYSSPLFWDSLYPDSFFDSGYPVAATPPFIMVQQPSAPQTAASVHEPAQPLLIELRGGRYVRISGEQGPDSDADNAGPQLLAPLRPGYEVKATRTASASPSAILVFQDGSHEEISAYTIVDGALYAQENLYTEGSWNKKIPISSLNLVATAQENQARGISFQLPTAPNQVIVGP